MTILFHIALFFSEFRFLGPLMIFGIYCINGRVFINVLIMCFLTASINAYLKSIWQVPLDPSLGVPGWAFPSGHTQFNLVLWLMILYQIRKFWVALIALSITILSYFGMVHFHYHNWYDIYGGIFFGALIFLIFIIWDHLFKNKQLELGIVSFVLSVIIAIILPPHPSNYIWLFVYLGMSTGLLSYLLLERLGYMSIISKLDTEHLRSFLLALILMHIINNMAAYNLALAYLKGFILTSVAMLCISKPK